jgi:hypothetical protein
MLAKPASLPPIVMVTRSVPAFRADNWLFSTSAVVAPEHAANWNDETAWPLTHSCGYPRGLRKQFPLAGS